MQQVSLMHIISCLPLRNRNVSHFNPLTPNNDQQLIPPYNNAPESHIKVISHQVVTGKEAPDCLTNSLCYHLG